MDKKEARRILKVTKDASRNDIERKYAIYLKRHRAEQAKMVEDQEAGEEQDENALHDSDAASAKPSQPEEYTFEEITEAYDILMGYEVKQKEYVPGKAAPLLKKAGIDERKAKNFLYYYKYHILAIIAVILIIVFSVRGCVNSVKPDFNMAFVGRFIYTDVAEGLKDIIKANVPEIAEPGIDGAYLADDSVGEQQYAMEMKAAVLLAASDIDVYIMDKTTFARFAKQGAFISLDEIAPRLGVDLEANKEFIVGVEGSSAETEGLSEEEAADNTAKEPVKTHLYGIDVSNSAALKEAGVIGDEKIACIYIGCEQIEKAEKLIQFFMKE
jgi:hypothetical protein